MSESLEARFTQLERRCRRQGIAILGLCVMLGGFALAGAQKPPARFDELECKTLVAREVLVKDAKGKDRIVLDSRGDATIAVNDPREDPRFLITVGSSPLIALN